jgi:hypothetical protein
MSDVLLTSMIEKMDVNERKMEELSSKVTAIADYTDALDAIVKSADEIKVHLQKISFPEHEVDVLCGYLSSTITLLKQPPEQKVIHHHHASAILWVAVVLFIMECVTLTAWYQTTDKLQVTKRTTLSIAILN